MTEMTARKLAQDIVNGCGGVDCRTLGACVNCIERLIEAERKKTKLLARLAATGPAFDNPLMAWEAENLRDEILASMNMYPDGNYKNAASILESTNG